MDTAPASVPPRALLPVPFDEPTPGPRTLLERAMERASWAARQKPDWPRKLAERGAEWRAELLAQGESGVMTPAAADYVLAELLWYAGRRREFAVDGGRAWAEPAIDGTWFGDGLVPEALRRALAAGADALRGDGPADWQPDTGGRVRNLVHPSPWCLVYGESPVDAALLAAPPGGVPLWPAGERWWQRAVLGGRIPMLASAEVLDRARRAKAAGEHPQTDPNLCGRYAWLPAEFDVAADGRVSILSYINGAHPRHGGLYRAVAGVFGRLVPLFEAVLGELRSSIFGTGSARSGGSSGWHPGARPPRITPNPYDWYSVPTLGEVARATGLPWEQFKSAFLMSPAASDSDEGAAAAAEPALDWYPATAMGNIARASGLPWHRFAADMMGAYTAADDKPGDDTAEVRPDYDRLIDTSIDCEELELDRDGLGECWLEYRRPITPQPDAFEAPATTPAPYSLLGRRLQVIVKMADIELTPENPEHPAGGWHVEGMLNERIVATALYYYDCDNVEPPVLEFRTAVTDPDYEQNDGEGVEAVYGLEDGKPLVQGLGSIRTTPGRCLVFPNVCQHRLGACRLVDPTRPGRRRALAFFLVDPAYRIPSTLFVPPQRASWIMWAFRGKGRFAALPDEVVALIAEFLEGFGPPPAQCAGFLEWPMGRESALAHRAALMGERKSFTDELTQTVFEREFSLCEH